MYISTVQESENGLVLSVPADMKAELGLEPGSTVEIDLNRDAHRLVIRRARPGYSLQELLDQCDPTAPMSEEDKQWEAMAPVGRELL